MNKKLNSNTQSEESSQKTVLNDLTPIDQLAAKLKEVEASLVLVENMLEVSTEPMAALDADLAFIKVNRPFVQAFSIIFNIKICVGINFLDILSGYPELKAEIKNACDLAKFDEKAVVTIENSSGNEAAGYCYEIIFKPMCDENTKNYLGLSCRLLSISESKLKHRQHFKQHAILASAARIQAVGEMAAALAHEINQPLAAINIYSQSCFELLKRADHLNSHANLFKGLEQITLLSQHASEILYRMKGFLRDGELYTESTDINILIKHALSFIDYQKNEFKFEMDLNLNEELPPIFLDKVKIIQVVLNLIQNGVDALQDYKQYYPKITIETNKVDDFIEVSVRDNGPGIPQEIVDRIMKSYFTTKSHGTGLGLAICRTLIEAHGGKLNIKDTDGNGALIAFTLPIKLSGS